MDLFVKVLVTSSLALEARWIISYVNGNSYTVTNSFADTAKSEYQAATYAVLVEAFAY